MKQIFDWLREQCKDRSESCYKSYLKLKSDEDYGCSFAYAHAVDLINEAEAKWKSDFCEWRFEKNTGLVWHCENECESYNISYQRELKTFLEEFECKCPHCGKPIKISEVE